MAKWDQPYGGVCIFLVVLQTVIQCCNCIYAGRKYVKKARTTFIAGLGLEQILMLGFCLVNVARTQYPSTESVRLLILSVFANFFFNFGALIHVLLIVFRFRLVNTGWYNRIWDTVMVWVTVGIFFVTFIPSIGIAIYQACNPVAPGEPLPLNVAIVICYAVFIFYTLIVDTVLGTLMYRRLKSVKEASATKRPTQTNSSLTTDSLHNRTVGTLIGLVILSWIAVIIFIASSFSSNAKVSDTLAQLSYTVTATYMSASCIYLISIKQLLKGYGYQVSHSGSMPGRKSASVGVGASTTLGPKAG